MAPRVVVSGWIGSTNLGDELIASVMLRRLADRGIEAIVPSVDPATTEAGFGVSALPHRSWRHNRAALDSADGLVFGGGSLVQDMTSVLSLPYHLARPWQASRRGVPVVGVGLDAGPLQRGWSRRLAARALRRAKVIGVRNQASADLLRQIGLDRIEVTADLAIAHPTPQVTVRDIVAVCLRPPVRGGLRPVASRAGEHDEAWLVAMAGALDELSTTTGLAVRFVAMQPDRDREVHEAVGRSMTVPVEHVDPTLDTVMGLIGEARAVVAMRYHGGVAALVGGRPAVMLGYASKVDSLVGQVGRGFRGLGVDEDSVGRIPEALDSVLDREDDVATARHRLRQLEARNAALLDVLVDSI